MNVYEKLMKVQSELKAPKGQYNNFGKYKYRSCEDILEAVKPLLNKNGAAVTITDEPIFVGERYYIKATASFIDITDGNAVTNSALARESADKKGMDESQITGTASSYARKYALNGLFLIDDTKDADTDDYHNQTTRKKTDEQKNQALIDSVDKDLVPHGEGMTDERCKRLRGEMERTGVSEAEILKHYNVAGITDMSESQYISAINKFSKTKTKAS